jgi:hypothetical protein
LLRGRFLRNVVLPVEEEERPPSVAARELGQLRQSHRVSTLRLAGIPVPTFSCNCSYILIGISLT